MSSERREGEKVGEHEVSFLWIVTDPSATSQIYDICRRQKMADFPNTVVVTKELYPYGWEAVHPRFYPDTEEGKAAAVSDARGRLVAAAERLRREAEKQF